MESISRFEILNTIATGDFATVYRARDREIGREVAIKEIHRQFLSDPRQLERYWREAQLLASLQHSNVLTIHDIDRSKGWLILELMQGNLQRTVQTAPADLEQVRIAVLCGLKGLEFLHAHGIIHGGVKPSNLLVDAQGRVKLGDFGLARRASNEQGSLVKGTTKYMAPELVSDQFGPAGPAGDLYSLGFSAYELICGPQFDNLFPGLSTFGRDRQTAWLMWHAAPDRRLPEIARVLEGVPEDLAQVIERLVIKDPVQRYSSAQEALADLRKGQSVSGAAPGDLAPESAKGKKGRRAAAVTAVALSAILGICMLLPSSPGPVETRQTQAIEGVVRMIDPDRRILALDLPDGNVTELRDIKPDDRFFVNDQRALLGDLKPQDHVRIQYLRGEDGRKVAEVYATRPQTTEGRIKAVDARAGTMAVALGAGGEELTVRVPDTIKIRFNDQEGLPGQTVNLADLRPGDRVRVQHAAEESGRAALALSAQRIVHLNGTIRAVNLQKQSLTLETGEGKQAAMLDLPLAPDCKVHLNHSDQLDGRVLSAADLRPGDAAKIARHVRVVSIDAVRVLKDHGVVRSVQAPIIAVEIEGQERPRDFLVEAACKITLGGEPAGIEDLRGGDTVEIVHDAPSPGTPNPRALAIAASRPEDRSRWAIVIGVEHYDDAALGEAPTAAADARRVRDALVHRHGVPAGQALELTDPSLVRLQQGIASLLELVQPTDQLIVYYAGRAVRDADGKVYLAPKEFHRNQAAATGLGLQALVDQLEACQAKEKILILDAKNVGHVSNVPPSQRHVGNVPHKPDPQQELSTAEMFQTLRLPMRSVTGIASCSEGQRGQTLAEGKAGLFAQSVADGLSGRADTNRDGRLETTELLPFLNQSMAAAKPAQPQTARLFLPDARPPRLSDEAKQAIRALAATVRQSDVTLAGARAKFITAQEKAGKEVEPRLLFGLALLKVRQPAEAKRHFQELRVEKPHLLLPLEGLVWTCFDRRDYADSLRELAELVGAVGHVANVPHNSAEAQQIFTWAGKLREFAAEVDPPRSVSSDLLQQLDAAVASRGQPAASLYQEGRDAAKVVFQDFDARIAAATDEAAKAKLRIDRRNLRHYAAFPFDAAVQSVLNGLDQTPAGSSGR